MKLKDCKIGTLVLATKKSLGSKNLKSFLRTYPLGVAYITGVDKKREYVQVGHPERFSFLFNPEDITLLKEINDD